MAYKACKIDAKQQLCGGGDGRGRLPCGLWSATGGADGTAPGEGSLDLGVDMCSPSFSCDERQ